MAPKEILDFMPEDVHKRIATYLRSDSYRDSLQFAKQSEQQRRSMVEALDYTLVLNDSIRDDVSEWVDIFGDDVRTLDISKLSNPTFLFRRINPLPNLCSATVYATIAQLQGIRYSPKCTSLKVVMFYRMNLRALIQTLLSLPLKELTLECSCDAINAYCAYQDLSQEDMIMMAGACQSVTKLNLLCDCDDTVTFWPIVFAMRSLKHLSFDAPITNDTVQRLHEFEEVEFHENIAIRQVVKLGDSVTAVTQLRRASIETVRLLSKVPYLKTLRLAMLDGAEKALPQLIQNVEELDLTWGYDDFFDEIDAVDEVEAYGDGDVSFDSDIVDYYPLDPHFLHQILQRAPKLRKLHFRKAVIKSEVLQLIMQKLGPNLEVLSIHMDEQNENPVERFLKIMQAGFTWCPNVKKINLLGGMIEKRATHSVKQSCYTALRLLRKTSVFVATTRLTQFVDGIEEIPGV